MTKVDRILKFSTSSIMKKNKSVLLALFAMLTFSGLFGNALGKACLKGTVRDKKTNEVLPGVQVYFPEFKTGTATIADGSYQICELPAVKVLVKVSMTGYATITEQIELTDTSHFDFYLEVSIAEMREVVITGTSHASEVRRSPVPMAIINHEYLKQNSSSNIVDAISNIPGVSAVSTGPNVSKPYIRGLGGTRVLSLYDGIRQDGQQWGEEHGVEIDQFQIDRIELVKGPASLIYGSDAMAGVINFMPADPLPVGYVKGSALINYMSNNRQIGTSLAAAGNNNGMIWGIRLSHKQATNYTNAYDGRVYGTKFSESNLNGYAGLNRSWGYSYIGFSVYDNTQEIPDGSRDSLSRRFVKQITEEDTLRPIVSDDELNSYSIGVIHQRVQHYRVYSNSNIFIGQSKIAARFGFQQSKRREFGHPQNADLAALYMQLNTFTYDLKYHFPVWNNIESTAGLNGMLQQNKNKEATEFLIPDYQLFDFGPFLFAKMSVWKFDFAFGLRYDIRSFENSPLYTKTDATTGFDMQTAFVPGDTTILQQFDSYSHTFSGLSASAGATFNFNSRICLKANLGRGYRAPNIAEISAHGVHPGTGYMQLGEINLLPEFNMQGDAGFFLVLEHFSASVEAFSSVISNYIYNEKLLSVNGGDSIFVQNGTDYPVFKYHQTKARLNGGEFSMDLHPHPLDWLHFENSVSILFAENLGGNGADINDSTRYLPLIPPFHTSTLIRADIPKTGKYFSAVYVRAGMHYYAAQERAYLAYGTETVTPSYTLFEAGIGGTIRNKKGATVCSIDLAGTNLADIAYQSNMSRLKYMDNYPDNGTGRSGIYNMGRNFSVKLTFPIDMKKPTGEPEVIEVVK